MLSACGKDHNPQAKQKDTMSEKISTKKSRMEAPEPIRKSTKCVLLSSIKEM